MWALHLYRYMIIFQNHSLEGWQQELKGDSIHLFGISCKQFMKNLIFHDKLESLGKNKITTRWNEESTKNGSHTGDTQEDYLADLDQICPGDHGRILIVGLISFSFCWGGNSLCLRRTKPSRIQMQNTISKWFHKKLRWSDWQMTTIKKHWA